MKEQSIKTDKGTIYFDAEIVPHIDEHFFSAAKDSANDSAIGRGEAHLFSKDGESLILRHYRRGGLVARLIKDLYLGYRIEKSRPWLEWQLLKEMIGWGLPVPAPVAIRFSPSLGFSYRGDIVMRVIPGVTLADYLIKKPLKRELWWQIGVTIRHFHQRGIYHADLNARNIMVSDDSEIFIIDFDRGEVRKKSGGWQSANLQRLRRSIDKLSRHQQTFHFAESDWDSLLSGYKE